ncbi:MAG: argininosuccinate lyase, partial [Desulfobacterota bacterium]|nr:argininosuccinate lyase [Thermodesulfobacteriota bacterium]
FAQGKFSLIPDKEDVHTNIESFLIEKYGINVGGKLHTARSRNDQVTLDMALFIREKNLDFIHQIITLEDTIITLSNAHIETIIPGYTHHQHAMVTTFGHLIFSYGEAFLRDLYRLQNWHCLFNLNPLGGAASYGTSFPIDRELTSRLLGFDQPSLSSLDLITNRWEAEAELGYGLSMIMNHLSGLAQTLILFTTTEFGFITLSDRYCGGSSIMPQKRNPSALEVIKAKAAVVQGYLGGLLSLSRGLFVGYNRDSQWTKYIIMDLISECQQAPLIMAAVLDTLAIDKKRAGELCQRGFITATDLMEALTQKFSLPLRKAKLLIEKAVKYSESQNQETVSWEGINSAIKEMDLKLNLTPAFVAKSQEPQQVVYQRKAIGGPAPDTLQKAIDKLNSHLERIKTWLNDKRHQLQSAQRMLEEMEKKLLSL